MISPRKTKYFTTACCVLSLFVFASKVVGQSLFAKSPTTETHIQLEKVTVRSVDSVVILVTLTNRTADVQKLLFINPATVAMGPWSVSADVIAVKTGKSVVQIKNRAILSSQIYTEKQLKDRYIFLAPEKSVSHKYHLTNIVVLKNDQQILSPGEYEIQLFYADNPSNKVNFYIR